MCRFGLRSCGQGGVRVWYDGDDGRTVETISGGSSQRRERERRQVSRGDVDGRLDLGRCCAGKDH